MPMLVNANALQIPLADQSVHCVVTSPPYWALRDYGTPGQLGLEPLHDCLGWATSDNCGACYVCHMRAVFAEVWRVLRDDGTLWLNLGDSYNGSGGAGGDYNPGGLKAGQPKYPGHRGAGLKVKDLVGIPWRVAFALQADGWYLRSDIIWAKPNPMPESVTDRPTKAHEYLFLFSKSPKYYYDAHAIRENGEGTYNKGGFRNGGEGKYIHDGSFLNSGEGIAKAGIVQRPNVKNKPLVLSQNFGFQEPSSEHSFLPPSVDALPAGDFFSISVCLAASILDGAQTQNNFSLLALNPEIRQQNLYNLTRGLVVSNPIARVAASEASRFSNGDISAKDFLHQLYRLWITLPEGDNLKEAWRVIFGISMPVVNPDGDGSIRVNNSGEISESEFVHSEQYTIEDTYSQTTRNRRTVWTIATAPYSGAHFATYPPALVEPCIKAGTSERGVCPKCGKPWKRVVERGYRAPAQEDVIAEMIAKGVPRQKANLYGNPTRDPKLYAANPDKFLGWQPTCTCDAGDPVPAICLDPFNGAATTGLVCQQLGRRYVGLDLSPEYLKLSRERLGMNAWDEWTNGKRAGAADLGPLFGGAA
jgi:DNA modification methylase